MEGWPRAVVGKSDAGSLNSLAGAISRRQNPARAAASVFQIWSIATDYWANLQAPWRTHKPLILLGFWCPGCPGESPRTPLCGLFISCSGAWARTPRVEGGLGLHWNRHCGTLGRERYYEKGRQSRGMTSGGAGRG